MGTKKEAAEMNLLRKITVSEVMGKEFMKGLARHLDGVSKEMKGKRAWLVRIAGAAGASKPGAKDDRTWIRFVGEFEATNLVTGEVFHSAACILPNFIAEQIHAAMLPREGEPTKMPLFAFDIGAHYDDDAITKYVFDVKALRAPETSQLIASMKAELPPLPALPAPRKKAA